MCLYISINYYSLVTKLMNSDTHSWTVSLASLAIFPLAGKAFFMIRLMLAIGRYRSCSRTFDRGLWSPPLSSGGLPGASAIVAGTLGPEKTSSVATLAFTNNTSNKILERGGGEGVGVLLPVEDEREGDLYLARAWRIDGWGCFRERRGDRTIKKEDERERERETGLLVLPYLWRIWRYKYAQLVNYNCPFKYLPFLVWTSN